MTELEELIQDEIRREGPVSFRRFMEMALYHPVFGYYRRERDPFGRSGDFFTNSQVQPVFGRLLAQQIRSWRAEMRNPPGFAVVEFGSGRGETLREIQGELPDIACAAVEISSAAPEAITGVIYSNEFFDALPVHLVGRKGGKIVEYFVKTGDSGFEWAEGEPSDDAIVAYIEQHAPGLAENQKIEVNLAALFELERMAASLRRGYLLTIDYGYAADEIASGRRFANGSLMSYERHQAREDVLTAPGGRDITAHVNFTALEQRGRQLGLASLGLKTQAQFLVDIGQQDNFRNALREADESENLQLRMQLKSLLFGMGEVFRVLIQRK